MTHSSSNSPSLPPMPLSAVSSSPPMTSPPSTSPFHNLAPDCIHNILHYHIFQLQSGNHWKDRSLYDLESDGIGNYNWNFLRKFAHCCRFFGDEGLREFLSACRDWSCKPTFSYLHLKYFSPISHMENGTVEYLRGIPQLDLLFRWPDIAVDLDRLFLNIRGVKKLSFAICDTNSPMIALSTQNLQNLRGIQEAQFYNCNFSDLPHKAFENLRGIQCLYVHSCVFRLSSELMRNLRGIRELEIFQCECDIYETEIISPDDFKNIRGVQLFSICSPFYPMDLTDEHLVHLRGVKTLDLFGEQARQVTDAAFVNFRGVEEAELGDLPNLSSTSLKNLRGIKKLTTSECPGIQFESITLSNLRGSIRELTWFELFPTYSFRDIVEGNVRNGEYFDAAFEQLHSVSKLYLRADEGEPSLSEAAFSHLAEVRQLELQEIDLTQVRKLTTLLQDHMPHLEEFSVYSTNLQLWMRISSLKEIVIKRRNTVSR